MNTIYLLQIVCYERGDQRLSPAMITFVGGLWVSMVSGMFGAISERLAWLNFLYYLSYIKVGTTPIKYTPQVQGTKQYRVSHFLSHVSISAANV